MFAPIFRLSPVLGRSSAGNRLPGSEYQGPDRKLSGVLADNLTVSNAEILSLCRLV